MSEAALPYELHVTVEKAQTKPAPFIRVCRELGVKALVLDLGVNHCGDLTDYMTSSKDLYEAEDDVFDELSRIAGGLADANFRIIRRKIETAPWHPSAPQVEGDVMPAGGYFESHLAIDCRPEDIPELREGIQESTDASRPFTYLSRNQLKPVVDGRIVMMATLRDHQKDFAHFAREIEASTQRVQELGFSLTKPPITEFSLYDSDIHHDDAWIAA